MKIRRLFLTGLCVVIGGILSSCDPSSFPYLVVDHVMVIGETPYVQASEAYSHGVGAGGPSGHQDHYFVSQNHGETWQEVSSLPETTPPAAGEAYGIHRTTCVPDEKTCYRIAGKEQVEISKDGGTTWQIDWAMPPGRKKFMERNPAITRLLGAVPHTLPYDFGIASTGNTHTVVVAMGNQGVLVKSSDGVWERYAVPSSTASTMVAAPLPFQASNFREAVQAVGSETTLVFLLAYLIFVALSFSAWEHITASANAANERKTQLTCIPFLLALSGFVVYGGLLLLESVSITPDYSSLFTFLLVPIIGSLISWLIVIAVIPNREAGLLAARRCAGDAIAVGIAAYLPFILWAFGIILIYEVAVVASMVLGTSVIVLVSLRRKRLAIQTANQ